MRSRLEWGHARPVPVVLDGVCSETTEQQRGPAGKLIFTATRDAERRRD